VAAGFCARCVAAPFDVVKIRLQLQAEPRHSISARYHGAFHTLRKVTTEEGILALWKGNFTAELLWMSFAGVQFATYHAMHDLLHQEETETHRGFYPSVIIGGTSAAIATIVTYPLDLMRTVFALQGEPKLLRSLKSVARSATANKGLSGLYQGSGAAVLAVMPYAGIQFGVYEHLQSALAESALQPQAKDFICGACSGVCAKVRTLIGVKHDFFFASTRDVKVSTLPLDLAKRRMQVRPPDVRPEGGEPRCGRSSSFRWTWRARGRASTGTCWM